MIFNNQYMDVLTFLFINAAITVSIVLFLLIYHLKYINNNIGYRIIRIGDKIESALSLIKDKINSIDRIINSVSDNITSVNEEISKKNYTIGKINNELNDLKRKFDDLALYINRIRADISKISHRAASSSPIVLTDNAERDNTLQLLDEKINNLLDLMKRISHKLEIYGRVNSLSENVSKINKSIISLSNEVKSLSKEIEPLITIITKLSEASKLKLYKELASTIKNYIEVYSRIKEMTDSGVLYGKMYEGFLKSMKNMIIESYNLLSQNKMTPEKIIKIDENLRNIRIMLKTLQTNIEDPTLLRVHRKITMEGSIAWPEIDTSDLEKIFDEIKNYMSGI